MRGTIGANQRGGRDGTERVNKRVCVCVGGGGASGDSRLFHPVFSVRFFLRAADRASVQRRRSKGGRNKTEATETAAEREREMCLGGKEEKAISTRKESKEI